jgi:hypothetical protein
MARPLRHGIRKYLLRYAVTLRRRSLAIPRVLGRRMGAIALAWLLVFLLASLPRILLAPTPIHGPRDLLELALPYLLVALAPIAGYALASGSFPLGKILPQPVVRLAIYGRWRALDPQVARSSPVFGPAGFMASLLIGLLLNVVMRSFEFLMALPALNHHAPAWGTALFHLMAADVVVMSFFYMVCFVMALRSVPLFPRMLLFVWALDILAQLIIAQQLGGAAHLPETVAQPLMKLLEGNISKVLISAFVWLPYLLLSDRVNVTYRQRIRA